MISTKNKNNSKVVQAGLKKVGLGILSLTLPQAQSHTARSWIEATFQKRECIKFIPSPKDEHKCCCGLSYTVHCGVSGAEFGHAGEQWTPSKHTQASPTDAYGTIEFQGGPHPSKAQYVRLAYDTRPELLVQLFTREWNLELPKLLITVQGGKANFELQPKLKKVLRKGLLKAAKTTGAWIFTGGTNTGVTRQVGDALLLERSQRSGRVVSIGIAPWGIVENNQELLGHNRDVPYHAIASPRSKFAVLNNRHAYFLLVDNGTGGRYGAEIILRRKLEKYISIQKLHPYTHSSTPVVCLVIEGGTNTIRAVLEYVTDNPPVPVVVCDGSGRAADLIAFVHKYATETGEQTVLESMKDYLIGTIQRTFEVQLEQAECLYNELLQCTRKKNLITVFRIQDRPESKSQELDQTILTALFKSQHLSPSEQLSLALTWNRVDIARSEIFVYGQEWPPGALNEAMMQALEHDRIDFVKLLLENGVSMRKFLTIPRLEDLYNTKQGPSNTLGYILRDVRPHIARGYVYALHDIGLVINKLMGGAYRAYYTRRKFRPIYAKVMNKQNVQRNSASFMRISGGGNSINLMTGLLPVTADMALFDYPFNELMIWAVLTKRQQMALLMWTHGEEALAKALVACKLYKAMAHEAAEDDLETEIYEELRNYGKEFELKALELLDYSYRQDDDQAQQLLTCELQNWSGQTCLSLAVAANHRALLAHPCSQIILADLWMGGLRTRKNTNLKVILGLLCPFYIVYLEFKSKEELQLMPQTEEEHFENESLEDGQSEDKHPDAESEKRTNRTLSIRNKSPSQQCVKALLAENYALRDTRVHENGKVGLTGLSNDSDSPISREFTPLPNLDYYELKQNRPLRLKKKLYEFFTAPITKFWADAMAYMLFLILFTYTVLVKMEHTPSWQELYSIAYICTLGCEKIREIVSSEPVAISHKFAVWAWNMWNPCDAATIIFFLIGLSLRLKPSTMDIGRVIYCVDSIYWYLRILNILGVNKYLGPLVTMMGKMVKNMIYFVVLLLVVLMSFGVCRQAILHPNQEPSWRLAREVFFQPYFMLYGEVFADQIYPPCGEHPDMEECATGRWVTPMVMSTYLLVANILLINLLIAVFNNIFIEVNAVAHQVYYQPYFMLYGEVFADDIDPPCGDDPGMEPCQTGHWFTPAVMSVYLLVANILLINLLIAVFNNIFIEVNAIAHQLCLLGHPDRAVVSVGLSMSRYHRSDRKSLITQYSDLHRFVELWGHLVNLQNNQVWMFQRFTVVMEYEQKPVLPPPLILLSHLYLLLKYLMRKFKGVRETYDNGLKLFLEKDDMERLYDFEEECVEGYFREQEYKLNQSMEERVRNTTERVENMWQKVEDINQKENLQITSIQNLEFRLRKMEDATDQVLSHLAVIHRFMATHMSGSPSPGGSQTDLVPELRTTDRLRRTSERSEIQSEADAHMSTLQITQPARRRPPVRSLTEVRPDAYIFDDGLHVEVRVPEEDEDDVGLIMDSVVPGQLDDSKIRSEKYKIRQVSDDPSSPSTALNEQHASTESKEAATQSEEDTMKESAEDIPELNFEGMRHRSVRRRRNSGRRSSEGGTGLSDISERSLHHIAMSRRQLSLTHSEPDNIDDPMNVLSRPVLTIERNVTWAEPRIQVIPPMQGHSGQPPSRGSILMTMHTEYTSITDELETVCGLRSPPITPRLLSPPRPGQGKLSPSTRRRHQSEMSNPEYALFMEKEHLRDAEENDYMLMENLIQRRYDDEEPPDTINLSVAVNTSDISDNVLTVVNENRDNRNSRFLRRSSAIEIRDVPTVPKGLLAVSEDISPFSSVEQIQEKNQHMLCAANTSDTRQNSAETNASSEMASTIGSFSHVVSEQAPFRPTITMDSSQLPIHRSLSETDSKTSLTMQSETMC